ncbi:MAG: amidohydrolase family protein, partial [Planctomycetaceae bacterium]|nr:amidohydrolase family protein [Planctomycetaceae bacterium]
TSAHLPRYFPPQLTAFLSGVGQDKVLFATNYPMLSLAKCVEQVTGLNLAPGVAEKFLRTNCRQVYQLEPPRRAP